MNRRRAWQSMAVSSVLQNIFIAASDCMRFCKTELNKIE